MKCPTCDGSGEVKDRRALPIPAGFDEFWAGYPKPRKMPKLPALRAWTALHIEVGSALCKAIMAGLARDRTSWDWRKERGRYVPHPSTWLNQRRWEDVAPEGEGRGGDDWKGINVG